MSDDPTLGFGKFVPGFDFLQNLAKGASQNLSQMPSLSNWIAPTLNVEELEKRIGELRAVHFWLEQNSKALGATIQALEVQKMTLSTLKGMNFNMTEMAEAMRAKTAETMAAGAQAATDTMAGAAQAVSGAAKSAGGKGAAAKAANDGAAKTQGAPAGVIDPLQWWGALTQQFQQIAADALKDAARNTAVDTARNMATGMAREAARSAGDVMRAATGAAAKSGGAKSASAGAKKASAGAKKTRKSPARKRGAADKT